MNNRKNARFITNGKLTDKDIYIEKKVLSHDSTLHWHDFFEIDLILEGSGIMVFNGKQYVIMSGLTSFSYRTDFHEFKVDSPLTLYNIQFKETIVSKEIISAFSMSTNFVSELLKTETNEIVNYCESLTREMNEKNLMRVEYIKNLLECILIILVRQHKKVFSLTKNTDNQIIQNVIIYLQNNFMNSPSLKDISQKFFLNGVYFSSLFHKSTGRKYSEYLRELKLCYAAKLIQFTSLQITEIAFKCGYKTFSHFLREFKVFFGVSPLSMRKEKNIDLYK